MQTVFLTAALCAALALTTACKSRNDASKTKETFVEDQGDRDKGNDRRRPAMAQETLLVVSTSPKPCTATLLAEDIILTADHCDLQVGDQLTSGFAINDNRYHDMVVTQSLERDYHLDFALFKIAWQKGDSNIPGDRDRNAYKERANFPKLQRVVKCIAAKPTDAILDQHRDMGTRVFTVGFPLYETDAWGAVFSQGQLKAAHNVVNDPETKDTTTPRESVKLAFDVGARVGNSGGPLFAVDTGALVGIVTAGPEGDGYDREDPTGWNSGPATWQMLDKSPTLQKLFRRNGCK